VRPDADRSPPTSRSKWKNLIKPVQQTGPLLGNDEPFELRPIRCELRFCQPPAQVFQCLLFGRSIGLYLLKPSGNSSQQIHDDAPQWCQLSIRAGTVSRSNRCEHLESVYGEWLPIWNGLLQDRYCTGILFSSTLGLSSLCWTSHQCRRCDIGASSLARMCL